MKSLKIVSGLFGIVTALALAACVSVATGASFGMVALVVVLLSAMLGVSGIGNYAFTLISGTPITFNGKEAVEGILEPAYASEELTEFMTIVEDIVARQQIAYLGRISKITQKDLGCGTGALNKTIPMSEKFWSPVAVKAWLTQCATDLENTFFVWGLSKGIKKYDLTDTDFMDFVLDLMTDAVKEDALRFVWFGDTGADTIANGSFLRSATDISFYDAINGFWKQIYAAVAGSTMTRVTITENAGVSYAAQLLPAGASYTYLISVVEAADSRLRSDKDGILLVSRPVWDNWITYRESKTIDSSFVRQEKGFTTAEFRGIKMYVMDSWSRNIDSDMDNGTIKYDPNRILYTTKKNLQVGMDSSSAPVEFKVWLNDETEINHMKGGYKVDVKIVHDFMAVAAY
jgi:hypothetical protein